MIRCSCAALLCVLSWVVGCAKPSAGETTKCRQDRREVGYKGTGACPCDLDCQCLKVWVSQFPDFARGSAGTPNYSTRLGTGTLVTSEDPEHLPEHPNVDGCYKYNIDLLSRCPYDLKEEESVAEIVYTFTADNPMPNLAFAGHGYEMEYAEHQPIPGTTSSNWLGIPGFQRTTAPNTFRIRVVHPGARASGGDFATATFYVCPPSEEGSPNGKFKVETTVLPAEATLLP